MELEAHDGAKRARAELRDQCAAGDRGDSCVLFGLAIVAGRPKDAQQTWRVSCDRNNAVACRLLAHELQDAKDSKPLQSRACKLGDAVACGALSEIAPPRSPTTPAWL